MSFDQIQHMLSEIPPLAKAWPSVIAAVGIIVGTLVAAWIIHRVVLAAATRVTKHMEGNVDEAVIRHTRRPVRWLITLFAFLIVVHLLPVEDDVQTWLKHVLALALTGCVGWLGIGAASAFADTLVSRIDITRADNLAARQVLTRIGMLRRVAVVAIFIVTLCLILMSFPSIRQIGVTLFASAGIAGLVIGMAARPALSNLIAGVQLALTEPIRIEDVVIVEGEWGWIEEIRSTYVVVRVWDLRRLVVPLSYFIEKPFQNWTRRTADLLGTVFIYADYTVPVDAVRRKLHEILKQNPLWNGEAWGLQVTDAKESTLELRALMSASTSSQAWDLRCQVREGLIEFLQREYPQCLPRARAELDSPKIDRIGNAPQAGV